MKVAINKSALRLLIAESVHIHIETNTHITGYKHVAIGTTDI